MGRHIFDKAFLGHSLIAVEIFGCVGREYIGSQIGCILLVPIKPVKFYLETILDFYDRGGLHAWQPRHYSQLYLSLIAILLTVHLADPVFLRWNVNNDNCKTPPVSLPHRTANLHP